MLYTGEQQPPPSKPTTLDDPSLDDWYKWHVHAPFAPPFAAACALAYCVLL